MRRVKVTWFNELKGIGEGLTSKNEIVFLIAAAITNKGIFKTLKKEQIIKVDIKKDKINGGLYSYKIALIR